MKRLDSFSRTMRTEIDTHRKFGGVEDSNSNRKFTFRRKRRLTLIQRDIQDQDPGWGQVTLVSKRLLG